MKSYLRILAYGRQYYRLVFAGFGLLVIYNALNAISLTLVIPFLEILFNAPAAPASEMPPLDWGSTASLKAHAYQWLALQMEAIGRVNVLLYFCGVVGTAIVLKNLARYFSNYLLAPFEQGVVRNLRAAVFDHLTRLSLSFYSRSRKGQLMNLAINDVQVVQEAVVGTVIPLISDPLTMVFFLISLLLISWKMTLFTLIILPVGGLIIAKVSKSLKKHARRGQGHLDQLTAVLDEFVGGIRIVKSFGAEAWERQRYGHWNDRFTHEMVMLRRRVGLASPATETLSVAVVLVIMYYGGTLILSGEGDLKPSEFIGFIAVFSQFIAPIKTLSSSLSRMQKALTSFGRIEELLAEPVEQTEQADGIRLHAFQNEIKIEDLRFAYGDTDVLRGLDLVVKRGQTVALVGPSGAGKTTLTDLVCRFYDPTGGNILLDGHNLRAIHPTSLRGLMGIVSQEAILFHDTIHNNIAYGRPDIPREAVMEAAKVANAHDFILELPEGYDTVIGDRGTRLSGGQRQRLSIARAVLKNPPILILDEATSALDNESERVVQAALNHLLQDRTSIVVAHRLSTIRKAHQIVVMDQGQIAEQGTHTELMARGGLYRRLYELQFGGAATD